MKVTQAATDSLIPYAFNNKKHPDKQVDMIANSIKEFGFNQPIVVDEDNIILVGHGRLLAAKKLGLEKIPVYKAEGLTEAKKKAYRILDNKLAGDAEWDKESLDIEINALQELDFDFTAWGMESFLPVEAPDFQPVSVDEQGRLDEKKKCMCPNCGHEFEPR